MIPYLRTFEEAGARIDELPGFYDKDYLTDEEYAGQFYGALVSIDQWETVATTELDRLMDSVAVMPPEIRELLASIIRERADSDYEPVTGLGIRMPEDEQRQRVPHERRVAEGLAAKIEAL